MPGEKLKGERVLVHCRVRPLNNNEVAQGQSTSVSGLKEPGCLVFKKENGETANLKFDSFFGPTIQQDSLYNVVAAPIVSNSLTGYNGTIFAYGQTGSGKTYSMIGASTSGDQRGVVPRAFEQIFSKVAEDTANEYKISLSYIQIYCEVLTDLLQPENRNLLIRESSANSSHNLKQQGVFVEGASSFTISTAEEALFYMNAGDENRNVAATDMNETSSRSHACMIIHIERRAAYTDGTEKPRVTCGKLTLVDLAGSERIKKSFGSSSLHHGSTRFLESKSINLSLSALGNCINALAKKAKHIPYRDSKLTRLLKDSLGGNSKTCLVLNVAPTAHDANETYSTFLFGERAMNVVTHAKLNEDVDYQTLYNQLLVAVDKKDDRIHALELDASQVAFKLAGLEALLQQEKHAKAQVESEVKLLRAAASGGGEGGESKDAFWEQEMQRLQQEHEQALQRMQEECQRTIESAKGNEHVAVDEWNRIEYDLKDEKEAHLEACTKLREKMEQLSELETSTGERIAELLDQAAAADEEKRKLSALLESAFQEREALRASEVALQSKAAALGEELAQAQDFQQRSVQLMEKLTLRVEQLEAQRQENCSDEEDEKGHRSSRRPPAKTQAYGGPKSIPSYMRPKVGRAAASYGGGEPSTSASILGTFHRS